MSDFERSASIDNISVSLDACNHAGSFAEPKEVTTLWIPGPPTGKDRPRFVSTAKGGRAFDTPKNILAQTDIRRAWEALDREPFGHVPLRMLVWAFVVRPKGHFKRGGDLSAEGKRHPVPTKKPDADNHIKLICDALNKHAYPDDVLICELHYSRRWVREGMQGTRVQIETIEGTYPWLSAS